ncbi:uncharacterized protein TRIADDRAFT_62068 [Trichoplax adhaerens]|uniref:Prolyl endopeptidase n=1 Tax=Trichoplax adhaerens TaxID=10228 RepID=B3SCR3_TRIAD|nr:hypothetical protein TRIADDRAFT_62068 [Trichoplax adhaerens]EDV19515.1 hypothetical protein TRIADDRAFT_62068 [Trichoplax adhaerens]|eukprot:XP_002118032.1 hypothetical protein TRIADDRAFT_62068 [Trichoplax adhaerens]
MATVILKGSMSKLISSEWIGNIHNKFSLPYQLLSRRLKFNWPFNRKDYISTPKAAIKPWTISVHGKTISDPYHWLKDQGNAAVMKYLQQENSYAKKVMTNTKSIQSKLVRTMSDIEAQLTVPPEILEKYEYYMKEESAASLPIYCRRKLDSNLVDNNEEVILDLNDLSKRHQHCCVGQLKVSPSHRLVAYTFDTNGKENYEAHIIDLSGNQPNVIDVIRDAFAVEFASNEDSIIYTKQNYRRRPYQVWLRAFDSRLTDRLLFQEDDEKYFLHIVCTKNHRFLTINLNSKSSSEVWALDTEKLKSKPVLIKERELDCECYVDHSNNHFYILTNDKSSGKYKVMMAPDQNPGRDNWKELQAMDKDSASDSTDTLLDDMDIFADYCVLYQRENLEPQITIVNLHSPLQCQTFKLPIGTIASASNFTFSADTVRFSYSSPLIADTFYELDMRTMALNNLTPSTIGLDSDQYSFYISHATSKDGCKIPISLCHRKDIVLNSSTPLLAIVYGAYGMELNRQFSVQNMCLLKAGWVLAFCHVRGGGEFGRHWYYQGRQLNKMNSFYDFLACINEVQDQGYTKPTLTSCKGTSAGGLIVAHLCNNHPNKIAAAIMKVPHVDILGTMLDQSLPLTVEEYEEWGDLNSSHVFDYICSYCPYTNIQRNLYPSLLLTASYNDNRVPYWSPVRFMAKLRAAQRDYQSQHEGATTNNKIYHILKTNLSSGHYGTAGDEGLKEAAFEIAFLHKALDLPDELLNTFN